MNDKLFGLTDGEFDRVIRWVLFIFHLVIFLILFLEGISS